MHVLLGLGLLAACSPPAPIDPAAPPPDVRRATLESLASLGYTGATGEAAGEGGVTRHRDDAAQAGLSLWTSGDSPAAFLTDLDGTRVHEWRWVPPTKGRRRYMRRRREYWSRAHAFENGDLLGLFQGRSLVRIDRQSRLRWAYFGDVRDFRALATDEILVLASKRRRRPPTEAAPTPAADVLTWLTADGEERRRLSLADCFAGSPFWPEGEAVDALAIHPVDERPASTGRRHPRVGRVVVVLPAALAVVDPKERRVVRVERAPAGRWRDAQLLSNGRLLSFENGDPAHGSRVAELDLRTGTPTWEYGRADGNTFYTSEGGTIQRLANGNTLITETERGRALELDPTGELVWQLVNDRGAGPGSAYRATIPELQRLPPDFELRAR